MYRVKSGIFSSCSVFIEKNKIEEHFIAFDKWFVSSEMLLFYTLDLPDGLFDWDCIVDIKSYHKFALLLMEYILFKYFISLYFLVPLH